MPDFYPLSRYSQQELRKLRHMATWQPPHKPWLESRCMCSTCRKAKELKGKKMTPKLKPPVPKVIHVNVIVTGHLAFDITDEEEYKNILTMLNKGASVDELNEYFDPVASGVKTQQTITLKTPCLGGNTITKIVEGDEGITITYEPDFSVAW